MTNPEMSLLFKSNDTKGIPTMKKALESRIRTFFRDFPRSMEGKSLGISVIDDSCCDIEFARFFATQYPYISKEEEQFLFTMELYFDDGIIGQSDEGGYSEFEQFYPVVPFLIHHLRSEGLIQAGFDGFGRQLIEYPVCFRTPILWKYYEHFTFCPLTKHTNQSEGRQLVL